MGLCAGARGSGQESGLGVAGAVHHQGTAPHADVVSDEIRIYLQALYQSGIRRQFKLALHLILLTLVRKSELLLAQWWHVDFEGGEWHIPEQNSKTGKPHVVYLSKQAVELFRELKALAGSSEWVLPGRGGSGKPFAHNALNKALNGVNVPIDPFTIHDLRRTGSTRLNEAGFAYDVIEKSLNHTIGGMRGIYNSRRVLKPAARDAAILGGLSGCAKSRG